MEKKKLLKRLSALGFAMYECRLYCDTHPNDTEALQMLNDYKSKYEAVKAEFEKQYGPLTLNGFNSDEWLKDPWPWDIVEWNYVLEWISAKFIISTTFHSPLPQKAYAFRGPRQIISTFKHEQKCPCLFFLFNGWQNELIMINWQ